MSAPQTLNIYKYLKIMIINGLKWKYFHVNYNKINIYLKKIISNSHTGSKSLSLLKKYSWVNNEYIATHTVIN